ncbi:MAG: DNA-binding protein [Arenimonas sp.]
MAKGITQEQVNQAADSLLLVGERPTIERIRAVLGTGSPNTVNRFLDSWWTGLGQRLTAVHAKTTLPEAPPEIANLASQLWERAIQFAQDQAHRDLDTNHQALSLERAEIAAQRATFEAQLEQMKTDRDAAIQSSEAATLRLSDVLRLVDQQTAQIDDAHGQRDRAMSELSAVQTTLATMQSELQQRQAAWDEERSALEATHTAMQDRWLGEVDRARQDETKLAAKLKQLEHAAEASAAKAGEQIAELTKRLQQTEREEAKKTARISSLEGEIHRVHEQLKARLQVKPAGIKPPIKKTKKTH